MIGNILKNVETGKKLGCIVHYNPMAQQVVIFRATSPDHPSFGRVSLTSLPPGIIVDGNINDYQHADIKQYLLRYLRTRNLSPTEERVMSSIKNYAFPNGLPKYDSTIQNTDIEGERQSLNLDKSAIAGRCMYINTPAISPFQHLDNHKVYVISRDDAGLWVCTMDNSAPITSYLPFKVRPGAETGAVSCHGISRMMPLDEQPIQSQLDKYSNLDNDAVSQIIVNGTRVKILPKDGNRVIVPSTTEYKGKYYDYKLGNLVNEPINQTHAATGTMNMANNIAVMGAGNIAGMFDNEAPISSPPPVEISKSTMDDTYIVDEYGDDGLLSILDGLEENNAPIHRITTSDIIGDNEEQENNIEYTDKLVKTRKQKGSGKNDSGVVEDVEEDTLDSEIAAIMQEDAGLRKSVKDVENNEINNSGRNSSMSEMELEFVDDDVEELGVFQKIRQMPVAESDKVYKESIQRGRLLKQYLEKIPAVLRENPYWLNRIRKDVNTISLMKALGTVVDKSRIDATGSSVTLRVPEFKPLVEKMMNRDFTNKLLIPLVAARKRIYLQTKDTIGASEFDPDTAEVIENTYEHLEKEELLVETAAGGGIVRRQVDIDNELGKQVAENVPELAHNNTMGLLFRLGEGIQPEASVNKPMGTTKLQSQRAADRQAAINQDTMVIRYGGGDAGMTIQGYGIEATAFDTFMALGPLARYVNEDNTRLTVAEIEAMEDQIDRNIDVNSSRYKVYYNGDNLSLLGFVRPPLSSYVKEAKAGVDSLRKQLNDAEAEGNVLVRRIGKRYIDTDENELDVMENPDKFIMYIMPLDGKMQLDDTILRKQLFKMIPDINTYVDTMTKSFKPKTSEDIATLVNALNKLEYFYPNNTETVKILAGSTTYKLRGYEVPPYIHAGTIPMAITYDDYESFKIIEEAVAKQSKALSDKLDRMIKLGKYRKRKTAEKESVMGSEKKVKRSGIIIPDELIEMANKVYGEDEQYNLELSVANMNQEEIARLEFYAKQNDNGQYINLLIHLTLLERLDKELDKSTLELELQRLKDKYDAEVGGISMSERMESLRPALRNKLQACRRRIDRKPKIMKYPSLERLEADNGHVITNARGEVIQSGDYALIINGGIDTSTGKQQHLIYKREQLATGDYWISQPINALEELIKKKKDTCETNSGLNKSSINSNINKEATKEDLLQLPDERCLFDISKVECMPDEMAAMDNNMANLEAQIADVKGQLDMAITVPVLITEVKHAMKEFEQQINALSSSKKALRKYKAGKDKELANELVAMRNKKQDCPHFLATEYLDSLKNITVTERYHLVQKILDIYADQEQSSGLNLDEVAGDPDANYVRCHVCGQNLMCKHNLFAITMLHAAVGMDDNADAAQINDELMAEKYGHEVGGSIYCRICGYFLSNTAVQDIEEFEKQAGKEGLHTKTREVFEKRDIIEQQKQAISRIMRDALTTDTTGDMKFRLRIYKLVKDLCGLDMLSVEDEMDMINFIKAYNFIPKKVFYTRLYVMFMKLKKQAPPAVLDKLANNQYLLHVTGDIMGRFLITLQTSRQIYQVYNSLCVNNIMGWPLLRVLEDSKQRAGVEFMACLAKQMALAPSGDFTYLNPVDKFAGILEKRIEEMINSDIYIREKLENALDDKYQHITFMEEMADAPAMFWLSFRPAMTFWESGVKWTPPAIATSIKDWKPDNVARLQSVINDNIAYQAQLLATDMARVVGESEPTTRFTLLSSIGNGCCPIDINKERQRSGIGKYGNPRVSYYMLPIRHIPEIANHIRKISSYQELLVFLQKEIYKTRYRLLSSRPHSVFEWYKIPVLDMNNVTVDMVQKYFMTYVDSPSKITSHGRPHLFDAFGRCLISNQLKTDITAVNYTEDDFRRLFRAVSAKQIVYRPPLDKNGIKILTNSGNTGLEFESCLLLSKYMSILNRLITLTGKQPKNQLRLDCPHVEKIYKHVTEALQLKLVMGMSSIPVLYSSIDIIVRESEVVVNILERIHSSSITSISEWQIMWDVLTNICHLLCTRFEEATIRHLNIAIFPKDIRINDSQRRYFGIISMLDTQVQGQIDKLVDIIGQNQKDENEIEEILVNVGDLKEIQKDYQTYLDKQLDIIPRIGGSHLNQDVLVSKRGNYNRIKFISKIINDLSRITQLLTNRAWTGLKSESEIVAKYNNITDFYQYKKNHNLIGRIMPLTNDVSQIASMLAMSVFPLPQLIQVEPGILQPELVSGLLHYSLIWMLGQFMSIISDKKSSPQTVSTLVSDTENDSIVDAVDNLEAKREATDGPTPEELVAMDGMREEDLDLYPELVVEGRDSATGFVEDDTQNGGGKQHNFHKKLVETRDNVKNVMISYIRDCIVFMADNHKLANDLNLTVIAQQIAKTKEQQVRRNLRVFKFLNEEGREDDYRLIKEMQRIGRLNWKDMDDYMKANFPGADDSESEAMFIGEPDDRDAKNYNKDQQLDDDMLGDDADVFAREREAKRDRLGFSAHEYGELGYVGEAEDMEGGDFDYGYVGVD